MADLRWGAGTDPGRVRSQNEDAVLADGGVFVVADGMGGHEAGEVASQLAIERLTENLVPDARTTGDGTDLDENGTDPDDAPGDADAGSAGTPTRPSPLPTATAVVEAITSANGDIFRAAIANPGQAGMGTTVTMIAVIEDPMAGRGAPNIDENDPIELDPDGNPRVTPVVPREQPEALVLANVGDSRTYLFRHDRLRRITVDHNYVQELVATGHITDDEARTHPRRNIITRALGIEPDVSVDWWTLPIIRGDRFVLCSDGLVDEVHDDDIAAALREHPDPQDATDHLIAMANEAGGRDNITVVVVDVLDGDDPPDPTVELDIVPEWGPPLGESLDPTDGSTSDGVDGEPSVNPELAALAASSSESDDGDAGADDDPGKARRSRRLRVIIGAVIAAGLVAAAIAGAAWARNGYFVDFDDERVTVYQGRDGGVLWIEPTVAFRGPERDRLTDDAIDAVESNRRFGSQSDARDFVADLELLDETDEGDEGADDEPAEDDTAAATTAPDDPPATTAP